MRRSPIVAVLAALGGIFLSSCLASPSVQAACRYVRGDKVVVAQAETGGVLRLADGRHVKLANIELVASSHDALAALAVGREYTLGYNGKRQDRHGRIVAYPLRGRTASLQSELVAAGLARVSVTRDNRRCAPELLAAEEKARLQSRGIWADPAFSIRDAQDVAALLKLEGSYQLVEGVVSRAALVRGRIYVNFGEDPGTDFTMTVAPGDARLFSKDRWERQGNEFPHLAGMRLRVRGWIGSYGGPQIVATTPEQVEFLDDANENVPMAEQVRP